MRLLFPLYRYERCHQSDTTICNSCPTSKPHGELILTIADLGGGPPKQGYKFGVLFIIFLITLIFDSCAVLYYFFLCSILICLAFLILSNVVCMFVGVVG